VHARASPPLSACAPHSVPAHHAAFGPSRRDLKPENILLDDKGNAKISDLGLATHATPSLAGRCGTRGCECHSLQSQPVPPPPHPACHRCVLADWAPEMLVKVDGRRQNYTYTVDWWSFGCLLYELLCGKCPFRTEAARSLDPDKHKASVGTGRAWLIGRCTNPPPTPPCHAQSMDKATLHLEVPYDERYFSSAAKSLLQGLLTRDPSRRLGARGAGEIKVRGGGGGDRVMSRCSQSHDDVAMSRRPTPSSRPSTGACWKRGCCPPPGCPRPPSMLQVRRRPSRHTPALWHLSRHRTCTRRPSPVSAAQDMIGAFDDAGKRVVLEEEDQNRYVGWEITNKNAFQQEMVEFLTYQVRATVMARRPATACVPPRATARDPVRDERRS